MAEYIESVGRRKTATARVRLYPGTGEIVVNDKPMDEYFGRDLDRMILMQPLTLTGSQASYNISIHVKGLRVSFTDCFQSSTSRAFLSLLQTAFNQSWGRPLALLPVASSPCSRSLGILPSCILRTCPSQRRRRCRSRVQVPGVAARLRTSWSVMRSGHLMPRVRLRLRMWKVLSLLSGLQYTVHMARCAERTARLCRLSP